MLKVIDFMHAAADELSDRGQLSSAVPQFPLLWSGGNDAPARAGARTNRRVRVKVSGWRQLAAHAGPGAAGFTASPWACR